jgi:WD40 repeat protein
MALPTPGAALGWIAVTKDGRRLATGGQDGKPRIWDLSNGNLLLEMAGHGHPIIDVAFSPDGQQLATGGVDFQTTVWDAQTGRELYTVLGDRLAYSPDGSRLITTDIGSARIFEAATGRQLSSYSVFGCAHSPAFSPDGSRLAFGESGAAIVRDPTTGRILFALKDPAPCGNDLAFSPDGTRLVTASNDGVKVWSVEPGLSSGAMVTASVHSLRTSTLVNSLAYDHTGARLATANVDGTATVWDPQTGQDLLTLSGGGWVWDVAFSPDGKYLFTGGEDAARVYLVHIGDLVALARTRVTRTWTADECVKYLRKDPATCASVAVGATPSAASTTAAVMPP